MGSHVASLLRAQGLRVRALHRLGSKTDHLKGLGCDLVSGALGDAPEPLADMLAGCNALVHAAALIHSNLPWSRVRAVNVEGTQDVLQAADSADVRRVVHISSVAVYGDQSGIIDEASSVTVPLRPGERYARSKREAECVLREIASGTGMAVAVLRPSAVYGERDRVLVPKLVQILRLPVHPLLGGGRTPMAAVYAGNVAQAVLVALRGPVPVGVRAYNVANDHPVTQRQLCAGLAARLGLRFRPLPIPAPVILGLAKLGDAAGLSIPGAEGVPLRRAALLGIRSNPYRSLRIRDELGWSPDVSVEEALTGTAKWIQGMGSRGDHRGDDG